MVTGKELTDRLGMHPTSIQKQGIGAETVLDRDTLIQFLGTRRKAAGQWRAEKAALADAWYCELTGEERITTQPGYTTTVTFKAEKSLFDDDRKFTAVNALPEKREPVYPQRTTVNLTTTEPGGKIIAPDANKKAVTKTHFLRSEGFMVAMLVLAILAQVLHTSTFFYFVTPIPIDPIRIITAIVVGLAVDSAALVKTIRSGRHIYLVIFAVVHFGINMSAHFRFASRFDEIDVDTIQFWFDSALLSFAVSYAVYCYAEAFAIQKPNADSNASQTQTMDT